MVHSSHPLKDGNVYRGHCYDEKVSAALAQIGKAFGGAKVRTPIRQRQMRYDAKHGWQIECEACEGSCDIVSYQGDRWDYHVTCRDCSRGWADAEPVDFDGCEFLLNGRGVSVSCFDGVLYACDFETNAEAAVSMDDLRPAVLS